MTADELERMLQPPNERPGPTPLATIPIKDKIWSVLGFGPMPATKVPATQALVDEINTHGPTLEPVTPREQVILLRAVTRAQHRLDHAVKNDVEPLADTIKKLHSQINGLSKAKDILSRAPIVDPTGALLTPENAQQRHDDLAEQVATGRRNGDRKDDLNSSRDGWKRIIALCADWLVLFLTFAILQNVNVQDIPVAIDGWIPAISAAIFATLGTVFVAVVAKGLGRSHRRFKTSAGTMPSPRTPTGRRILFERILIVLIIGALGTLMAVRIINDGRDAEAFLPLIVAMAVLLPLLIMGSTYLIYSDTMHDGSLDTDELRHRSAGLFSRQAQIQRYGKQISNNIEAAGLLTHNLARLLQRIRTTTNDVVSKSAETRCVLAARSYSGRNAALPKPDLDWSSLDLAEKQAQELAEHHRFLLCRQTDAGMEGQQDPFDFEEGR
ncbi:hypothetical protein [Microlunatus sp. GCM10028923]|uniref:hypothetical protein n=1 Tax=Microlunatus sp. GCM10028923 TaxID=3273400 RepID=UPI00361ADB03